MKGGQRPIHVQRWCPADFQADEEVRALVLERDWATLCFYRQFLDCSWMAGGDLPADRRHLAAAVGMPRELVESALEKLLGVKILEEDGRLYQPRVKRDVAKELAYREEQSVYGSLGGRTGGKGRPKGKVRGSHKGTPNPPAPAPAPPPPPSPSPSGNQSCSSGSDEESEFEQFWAVYPRKVAKADAKKAWKQTQKKRPENSELLPRIIAQTVAAGWKDPDRKEFVPLPATYLRGERWLDEPEELRRGGGDPKDVPAVLPIGMDEQRYRRYQRKFDGA